MENIFKFKKFQILQENIGAKIGTDGVLLGAWAEIKKDFNSFLDIGTGTGVIALMLAQRTNKSDKSIEAIDIDERASILATHNFKNSFWNKNLKIIKGDFLDYSFTKKYDCIVTNPPFYKNMFPIENTQRNRARNEDSLSFKGLLQKVSSILSRQGLFSLIVPYAYENEIISIALEVGLWVKKITRVRGNLHSQIKRSLICFSFTENQVEEDYLIIEKERHQYTQEYKNLVKDFYLKM